MYKEKISVMVGEEKKEVFPKWDTESANDGGLNKCPCIKNQNFCLSEDVMNKVVRKNHNYISNPYNL